MNGLVDVERDRPALAPTFSVGQVPVFGDLILSPMAGYTELPFRAICRELGSAMSYTPCVLDDGVLQHTRRSVAIFQFVPEERPVAIQILGKFPDRVVAACEKLMAWQPDIIDLNVGCPARRVSWRGRGAALLREPDTIGEIIRRLVQALPVPVTAKMRLGWDDDTRNYLEVARTIEQAGASAIAVHGRTKAQGYSGQADWEAIAEVKSAVGVPVLANGDVRTRADIEAIKAVTGCDAVLVGRGAVANPWIFQRRDLAEVPAEERLALAQRHLGAMQAYYGERVGLLLFRKFAVRYVQELDDATTLRTLLCVTEDRDEVLALLRRGLAGSGERAR
ncbi:MAG: tRNA dihydrouridine synthase DusB [Anaerolineae bacterium]